MPATIDPAEYRLAYLELKLAQDTTAGLIDWQVAYEQSLTDWQLADCRVLLGLVRRVSLNFIQRGAVLHLEGQLWEQWGDWLRAIGTLERAAKLHRQADYPRGLMVALNTLASLLRRSETRQAEAIPLYEQALALARQLEDEQAQAGILNNLGLACYETGRFEPAQTHLEQALTLARRIEDQTREGRVRHNLGALAWTQGRLSEAEDHFSAALAACRAQQDRVGEAETLSSLGITWEAQGNWDAAADAYQQALAILQTVGDHHGQAHVLVNLGNVAGLRGNFEQASGYYQGGLALARSLGDAQLEGALLGGLADIYTELGQFDAAETTFQHALARKAAINDDRSRAVTLMALGSLYHKQYRLTEAEQIYAEAIKLAQAIGNQRILTHAHINLARLAMLHPQPEVALPHLDQAEASALALEYHEALGDVAQLRGDILLWQGAADADEVARHYAIALAHAVDFNEATLQQRLNYLAGLLTAITADGDARRGRAIAAGIQQGWRLLTPGPPQQHILDFFDRLLADLDAKFPVEPH